LCFAAANGARNNFAPIADPTIAGPNFLAVDDVMVAVETASVCRLARSEPAFGSEKPLAPDFFGAQNFGHEAFLLHFGAVGNDRRTDEAKTQRIGPWRRLSQRHFFPENGLLASAWRCAAKFFGPGHGGPAAFIEFRCHARRYGYDSSSGLFSIPANLSEALAVSQERSSSLNFFSSV